MSLAHPSTVARRRVFAVQAAVTVVALATYVVAWSRPARPWWADLLAPALFLVIGLDLVTRGGGTASRLLGLACALVSASVLLDILF